MQNRLSCSQLNVLNMAGSASRIEYIAASVAARKPFPFVALDHRTQNTSAIAAKRKQSTHLNTSDTFPLYGSALTLVGWARAGEWACTVAAWS